MTPPEIVAEAPARPAAMPPTARPASGLLPRAVAWLKSLAGWRALLAAFVLGALTALAFPPVFALPVLLVCFPGLLILLGRATTWKRAALLGWAFGWGGHVTGLYWITHSILTEVERFWWLVPIAVPLLALFMGLYAVIPALLAWRARPGWSRILVLAGGWVLAEFVRGWAFTGFPWNLLGTAWAFDPVAIQGAAWIGTHGLSLITVLLACMPLLGRRGMLGGAFAFAFLGAFGVWRLSGAEPPPLPVSLVLVQGNVAQEAKWREETRMPIFRRYLDLSRQGIEAAARQAPGTRPVVIWPETASPFLLANDPEARRIAGEAIGPNGLLLAGTVRAVWGPDGRARELYNSMAAVTPDGTLAATFDKFHLVPFGEYMPLSGLLPVRLVRGGVDFSSGPGPLAVPLPGLPAVSPLICYEVIFPGAVVGAERPGWLLNITNDAWFGISAGPHQHLAAARMRAVEEGLPLARAAQTGISAVFDSRGREVARIPLGETGIALSPLPTAGAATPFSRIGLLLPGLLAGVCLLAGLLVGKRATRDP
ncbi:apolipoprotein N-acyltransferase [Roseomonas sp. CCTCC AB2023176]|uniref:apolipoprotein N-acyltransferase n=1 Tax=Roseomonas sp. CCTCC AB2023176 TaxID=3342640 RepID=UPI0035E02D46